MKKYGITLFLTLILLLGLVVPAVSAQVPEAALTAAQEQSPELLDATVVAKGMPSRSQAATFALHWRSSCAVRLPPKPQRMTAKSICPATASQLIAPW